VGEHTSDVLTDWLGYDNERLEKLAAAGAFGAAVTQDIR
jgi:hypothetical protein